MKFDYQAKADPKSQIKLISSFMKRPWKGICTILSGLKQPYGHNKIFEKTYAKKFGRKHQRKFTHTDALDCYDTPKMLILVVIKFRENKEW